MIKSDSQTTPASKQDALNQECWHRETGNPSVRFELEGTRVVMLPYIHFNSAWYEGGEEDQITVDFGSHEVTIKGYELLKLAIAFQKQTVEWVRVLPKRQQGALGREAGFVSEIAVKEKPSETES